MKTKISPFSCRNPSEGRLSQENMFRFVLVLVAAAYASAFAPARSSTRSMSMAMEGMSKSVPFLKKPKNLDGMAGNYEFDPLGFSEYNDVKWMREAELKNGRVAMLAVVGWLVTSAGIHLPSETGLYSVTNPIDAFFHVGPSVMGQIFCFCGALESLAHKGKMAPDNMFDDGRKPGNFGAFAPPLGGKDMADMEVKELKNGRLAMIAMGGLVHQQIIDGTETFGTFPISNIWNLPGAIGGL